jgi:hypothetical protein
MQILILEDQSLSSGSREPNDQLEAVRKDFLKALRGMPGQLINYVDISRRAQCVGLTIDSFPRLTDYRNMPHLYAAMAYLLLFVNNDGLALTTMRKARASLEFDDYTVPSLTAAFMYYSGDSADRYMDLLEKMRETSQTQRSEIKKATDRCPASGCMGSVKEWAPILLERTRVADITAMNIIAYGVAQDLAEGVKSSQTYQPLAEAYAEELTKAANTFPNDPIFGDSLLDTAAFVLIVTEAQKDTRNADKIKDAIAKLEKAAARQVRLLDTKSVRAKSDYATLKLIQSHITAARELLD